MAASLSGVERKGRILASIFFLFSSFSSNSDKSFRSFLNEATWRSELGQSSSSKSMMNWPTSVRAAWDISWPLKLTEPGTENKLNNAQKFSVQQNNGWDLNVVYISTTHSEGLLRRLQFNCKGSRYRIHIWSVLVIMTLRIMVSVALILEDTANTWLQMTNMIFSTTVFSIWLKTKYHFFTFEAFSTT